jgi:hypothetical protein
MGFLLSRGFPSSESVLLSESLPSCRETDFCSTTLSAARVDELIASGWLFNRPFTKSARDCRGFPSPESVHLLAVLPGMQGRASRVLVCDCDIPPVDDFTPAEWLENSSKLELSPRPAVVKMPKTNPLSATSEKTTFSFIIPNKYQQFHCAHATRQPLASQSPSRCNPTPEYQH